MEKEEEQMVRKKQRRIGAGTVYPRKKKDVKRCATVVPPKAAPEHKRIEALPPALLYTPGACTRLPSLNPSLRSRRIYSPELSSVSGSPLFSRFLRAALILVSKRCIMERRFLFSAS